jgi:hypothetical protein
MSKSVAKYITIGIAEGSNTKYYRKRTKIRRAKNKMKLRMSLKDDSDFIEFKQSKRNPYMEPTDGVRRVKSNNKYLKCYKGVYVTYDGKIKK